MGNTERLDSASGQSYKISIGLLLTLETLRLPVLPQGGAKSGKQRTWFTLPTARGQQEYLKVLQYGIPAD
jgi:hypothetical protein